MKAVRILAVLIAICCFAQSCSEPPAAPSVPAPQFERGPGSGGLLQSTGLLQCSDLAFDSETRWIGPGGGTITAGPHTLTIPSGALDRWTSITMSAPSGHGINAVHFEPDGLHFDRPATLTMGYGNCNLLGTLLPKRIAYTDDDYEKIYYFLLSLDNILSKRVTGKLDHFSDYVVAW
jgi:hypothetical protein